MKKVLVSMDFSKEAMYAMEIAVGIAKKSKAEILLAHIIEIPGHFYHSTGKFKAMDSEKLYVDELMFHFKERMREIIEDMRYQDVKMVHQIEIGNAYPSLKKMVLASRADLVVMGSKGISAYEELFLGRMIRYSNSPVLTIKSKVYVDKIQDIVFTTNCAKTPFYVTNQIQELAQSLGARLHVLKVNTKTDWKPNREVEQELREFVDFHQMKDCQIEIYNDETALEGIIHYSEDRKVDMLALMTHGRMGLAHLINGSIAEKVASHSGLPIWTCSFDHTK